MVLLTLVIAVSTTSYSCYEKKQLKVMSDQLTQMQGSSKQTDELIKLYGQQLTQLSKQTEDTHKLAAQSEKQASASINLSAATRQLVENAKQSLDATIANNKLEQRPWMATQTLRIETFGPKDGFRAVLTYANTGKTPASDVKMCQQLFPANYDLDGPTDERMLGAVCNTVGALPPQTPFASIATDDPGHYLGPLYDDIMAGKKFLFLWGKIRYLTSSAKPFSLSNPPELHMTYFCFEFDPLTNAFGICRESSANRMF